MKVNKFKIIKDFIFNTVSSFVFTATLQLITYPILSSRLGENKFGTVLTIIGVVNVIGVLFGSSLNNVRLLHQEKYKDVDGDFKILIRKSIVVSTIIMMIVIYIFRGQLNLLESIVLIFIPILIILRGYLGVYYRIELNYNMILSHMIIISIGYVLGIIIFTVIPSWPIVFLSGELISYIFLYNTTKYKYSINKKTQNYTKVKNDYNQLTISNAIANMMVYLDRLLINPILGASNVAIYFTASIIGKTVGIVLQPLSSVILTYITKFKLDGRRIFLIVTCIIVAFGFLTYVITIPLSPIVIKILYAESYEMAREYFNIANLAAILMVMGSLLQPLILKYCHLSWQWIIQLVYLIVYLIGGIVMMKRSGLIGFCNISVIANIIRLVMLWGVGVYYIFIKKVTSKG